MKKTQWDDYWGMREDKLDLIDAEMALLKQTGCKLIFLLYSCVYKYVWLAVRWCPCVLISYGSVGAGWCYVMFDVV